jgi:hypothetical protein
MFDGQTPSEFRDLRRDLIQYLGDSYDNARFWKRVWFTVAAH